MNSTALKATVAGVALLSMAGWAQAETVRVTVAEYSSKTGPYFEEMLGCSSMPSASRCTRAS